MIFLAPIMLAGLAFASAPIIIHLLNRRKFRTIEWAPMHYLKLTLRTNRRRLRLEQWILLAIRTLVILLLILAVARPLLAGSGAAGWLSLGDRTSRVILIDDSVSMGLQVDGESAFDRAISQAAALIESTGSQDSLTVATTSDLSNPLQRETVLTGQIGDELATQVRKLEPTATGSNWAATLAQLAEQLEGSAYRSREVRIFTDQRREGWSTQASAEAAKLADMGVKVTFINVGRAPQGNAALTELAQTTGVALANTPLRLTATITADGDAGLASRQATLTVDGQDNPIELPELAPNQTLEVPLNWTFAEPGEHTVTFALPNDAMPGDNTRSIVVNVEESVNVLLVDGQPGIEPRDSETFYLAVSLLIGDTPFKLSIQSDQEWFDSPIVGNYDLVILANVEQVPVQRAKQLNDAVRAGMGMMVFLGEQVDPTAYNAMLYDGGAGILPGQIDVGQVTEATGMVIESYTDSPVSTLLDVQRKAPSRLSMMAPTRIAPVELVEGAEGVRVLANWNDPDRSPAIIEKTLGQGRTLLFTTTADRQWSQWPADQTGSFVLAVREATLAIAGVNRSSGNLTAGDLIRQRVSTNTPPSRATVTIPGSDTANPATIQRADDGGRVEVLYDQTVNAGIYELTWDVPGGDERTRVFAVSPDARESDLTPLTGDELTQLLSGVDLTLIDTALADSADGMAGKEIWRTLAFGLLALVVIESAFASWVGREH